MCISCMFLAVCIPPCENGKCVRPNQCECKAGFTGKYCETGEKLVIIKITFCLIVGIGKTTTL